MLLRLLYLTLTSMLTLVRLLPKCDRDKEAEIHGELTSLGIKVAASTVWNILKEHGIGPAPERMNAIMERWVRSCRAELLDRTLIWNQTHLLRALREYEAFHNEHGPHRTLASAAPLHPLPEPNRRRRSMAASSTSAAQRWASGS
ncbi:hypothetical protein [Streptomyces sp. 5-10]|uniref:hypothetical protein n=1 Tax=Streptomyces sp. 5-10 TaxID=878925 RepID=UPI00351A40FE